MTTPPDRNPLMYGMPPNIGRRFEMTSDLVTLIMWNLNNGKGMAFKTSRPFPVMTKLAAHIVTGITGEELNIALRNLVLAGCCVVERKVIPGEHGKPIRFMFELEYEDETNVPVDSPYEVDPKQSALWDKNLFNLEAMRIPNSGIYAKTSEPVSESSSDEEHPFKV